MFSRRDMSKSQLYSVRGQVHLCWINVLLFLSTKPSSLSALSDAHIIKYPLWLLNLISVQYKFFTIIFIKYDSLDYLSMSKTKINAKMKSYILYGSHLTCRPQNQSKYHKTSHDTFMHTRSLQTPHRIQSTIQFYQHKLDSRIFKAGMDFD
jgi:hypothetical protein